MKNEIKIAALISINLFVAYIIVYIVLTMQSVDKLMFLVLIIPVLMIINYILIKHNIFLENQNHKKSSSEMREFLKKIDSEKILTYKGKKYVFTLGSIISAYFAGAVLIIFFYAYFYHLPINDWFQEIVLDHTFFILKLTTGLDAEILSYSPELQDPWLFSVEGSQFYRMTMHCTGVFFMGIFTSIIIVTPHSLSPETRNDIHWRKLKAFVIINTIFYLLNILRMVYSFYLHNLGYDWDLVHDTTCLLCLIILPPLLISLINIWVPEFAIAVYYPFFRLMKKRKEKKFKSLISKISKHSEN